MANSILRRHVQEDGVVLAGWSNRRRSFCELHVTKSSKVATETVERMAKLWEIEEAVRGQSPEARVAARQGVSAAIVRDLFTLWQATLSRVSGKSKLAEALRYAVSRRDIFERFLTDGRIEIDSNIANSDGGGRTPTARCSTAEISATRDRSMAFCPSQRCLVHAYGHSWTLLNKLSQMGRLTNWPAISANDDHALPKMKNSSLIANLIDGRAECCCKHQPWNGEAYGHIKISMLILICP
jgi:hypothetical protein